VPRRTGDEILFEDTPPRLRADLAPGGMHLQYAAFGLDFHQSAAAAWVVELR